MTAESLRQLSLSELYDLMVLIIEDYKALQKRIHNSDVSEIRKTEIKLIQKAIDERKSNLNATL